VSHRFFGLVLATSLLTPVATFADGEFQYPAGGTLGVSTGTYVEIDGSGDCRAARAGQVTYADTSDGQNYTAILQHESGYETFYEQLEFDTLAVNVGDQLNVGDEVGQSNATGFEIHRYGAPQFIPGSVNDQVNQGDPILATYDGLQGAMPAFTTIMISAQSAWMGPLGGLTINADGSWSQQIPGPRGTHFIRLVQGNLSASDLATINQALQTIAQDGASLDGALPGFVADGTSFKLDTTIAGTQHELTGWFGASRGNWDAGVLQLVSALQTIFNNNRSTTPPPPPALFDTITLSAFNGWTGNQGTLSINRDGSFTFNDPHLGIFAPQHLTQAELDSINQAFENMVTDETLDGSLPGFVPDGTSFTLDTTVQGAKHEVKGFFAGDHSSWDPGMAQLVDALNKIFMRVRH
jgi:hypothetical protein